MNIKKVEKSSGCLKQVKNSLEGVELLIKELNYHIIHSWGKVTFKQMERRALSLKKTITSFGAVKNPNSLFFVPISRVVVPLKRLMYSLLIVYTLLRRTYSFSVQILINDTLRHYPTHAILVICNF